MTRRCRLALLLTLALAGSEAHSAPEEQAPADSPLRLFDVGPLTLGRTNFVRRALGIVGPDRVSDEERPLFGAEGEEPILPVGTVEELLEVIRYQAAPDTWDSVAGSLLERLGGDGVLVRNVPEALQAVGQTIFALEQRWLEPLTLDVAAVRLPPGGATLDAAALAALTHGDRLDAAVTLSLLPDQRVCAFAGRETAYLQDYDVEVAQKAKISDPIVGVLNTGLEVQARALARDAGRRVRVELDVEVVGLTRIEPIAAGEERTLEVPLVTATRVRTTTELAAGVWTLLEGAAPRGEAAHVVILARARVGTRIATAPSSGFALPVLDGAGMTKVRDRAFSTEHLTRPNGSHRGPSLAVLPSNFTPPEPPELPEPAGALQAEELIELLRRAVAPEWWGSRQASLEMRKETLFVRAPEPAVAAVERMLQALEQALLWSVEVEGRLVELPAAHAALTGGPLDAAAEAALAKAIEDGTGTMMERLRVASLSGQRSHVTALEERAYIADFQVELAEDATTANPVVLTLRSGAVLDLVPRLNSTRDGVATSVRFTRSVPTQALRSVRSVHGEIQCPEMRVHELKADVELPLGRTTLAASWSAPGGRRTALLLTARLGARTAR